MSTEPGGVHCGTMWVRTAAVVLSMLVLWSIPAEASDSQDLKSLVGKILVLRNPDRGGRLDFDRSGSLTSKPNPGSVDSDGVLQITKAKEDRERVTLEAFRLLAYFDEAKKDIAYQQQSGKIRIRISRSADEPTAVWSARLQKIFFTAAEAQASFFDPMRRAELPGEVIKVGPGVVPPKPQYMPEPEYTPDAQKAKKTGIVLLQVIVTPDGHVRNARVVRSLDSGLDQKAVAAVRQWRFQPALKDGKPVAVLVNIEVAFNLY
jgi:TonB family protein